MWEPMRIPFRATDRIFYELDWSDDPELLEAVRRCVEGQKAAATQARQDFQLHPNARHEVSPEALEAILKAGTQISGVATEREISNCIAFNLKKVQGAVINPEVARVRNEADRMVGRRLTRIFREAERIVVKNSGHFWYPPGGYMGWHTNLRTPGWRLYINYVEEPGQSFFRYRDPESGRIVTAVDRQWNFRLFKITPKKPLWHAVYSDTNRFSLGYMVTLQPTLLGQLKGRVKNRLVRILA